MAEYQYRIINQQGKEKKGTMEGNSAKQVQAVLKSQQNIVISVEEVNFMNKELQLSWSGKLSAREASIFCRQFASIMEAGVGIYDALQMVSEQSENKYLKKALKDVYEDVSKGESLSDAMKKHDKIFSSMLCNMISAGELSGNVDVSFERMSLQFEKENKLKQSVGKVMIYPIILLFVLTAVIVVMMMWVIPNFVGMFEDLGAELPKITQIVVGISNFLVTKWWLLLLIVFFLVLGEKIYASSESGKRNIDRFKLKIPLFGQIQIKTECARFGRTLCTLIGAGIPLTLALEIIAKTTKNINYQKAILEAKEQILLGIPLSKSLKASGIFPAMVIHMVTIGEQTGNIEVMLENVANYYEEDVKFRTEQVMTFIEPMIIVFMAIVVGGLVLAIIQPMMQLYGSLGI